MTSGADPAPRGDPAGWLGRLFRPAGAVVAALAARLRAKPRAAGGDSLAAVLAGIEQGVVILGADGRVTQANALARSLLDLPTVSDARSLTLSDIQAREAALGSLLPLRLRDGAPPQTTVSDWCEWTRDGGAVIEIRMVRLADGGTVRTYRDVTDQRQAIDEAGASAAFANTLINSSPDCITLLDLDGNVTFMSDLGQELFEVWDFEQIRGRPFAAFFPDEHRGRFELALRRVRDGHTDRFSRVCPTMMGIERWWEFIVTPVHAVGIEPERLFVVARDITDRQAQARELERAKEAAERASQAKSQFLATMSHEIRTPLNAILGFAALAQRGRSLDPELSRQLVLIEKAGSSLLTIINDVLDLSKIEAGKLELERHPLRLRDLAEDCLSLTHWQAQEKGLGLDCHIVDDAPCRIVADEARVRQVLLNLLNNAVKFTPAGWVSLTIGRSGDGDRLVFAVEDTGIGISPERIGALFQDFVQGDGSISRQFGGTGLGLAISRRLAHLMGGDIEVQSVPGAGSTFRFHIPLVEAVARDADDAVGVLQPVARHVPRRILLVDDLDINLEIVGAMLRSAGHEVETAGSGPQAIASYRAQRHDLILMDVQMPDMDGLETTRRIRELDAAGRRVPVIALTANVFSQQVERYRLVGMNDHLGKPLDRDTLLARIDRWTQDSDAPEPEAKGSQPPAADRTLGELVALIGEAKVVELLGRLRAELPGRFVAPDPETLRADAHAIASSAGLLGFSVMSEAARALETALDSGQDMVPVLARALLARQETIARITELKATLESRMAA